LKTASLAAPDDGRVKVRPSFLSPPQSTEPRERGQSGQYGNTSEYVRDLIRKDQREQRVHRLRALEEAGLASGPGREDTPGDWAELRAIAVGTIE